MKFGSLVDYYRPNYCLLLASLLLGFPAIQAQAFDFIKQEPNNRDTRWTDIEENYMQLQVSDAYIDIYTGPGRGYPVFYVAEKSEWLKVIKRRTDWFQVKTSRQQLGWIKLADISKLSDHSGEAVIINDGSIDDYLNRRWEFGFGLSDFGGAEALNFRLGYRLTKNITTEFNLTQAVGDFSESQLYSLSINHQPFPEWWASPFWGLGVGKLNTTPKSTIVESDDRSDDTLQMTLGLQKYLSRNFALRVEYINHNVMTNRDTNEDINEWKAGFSVFF